MAGSEDKGVLNMNDLQIEGTWEVAGPSPGQILRQRIFGHKGVMIGGIILLIVIMAALAAPLLTSEDPYQQNIVQRFTPPVWHEKGTCDHLLGTDHLGRDYLSRLLYGARISLAVGFLVALIAGTIGTFLGVTGGFFGGKTDMVINYLMTVRLGLPSILVALAVVALVGGSIKVIVMVLGFILWDRFAVVARSAAMQIRSMDYVKAAKAGGCSAPRIVITEILPNIMNQLLVVASLEIAHAILFEAALSFLGLGVQPPLPSWGLMIAEGKNYIFFKPWLVGIPGAFLFLLILAVNLLGDGIRDVTAPEARL